MTTAFTKLHIMVDSHVTPTDDDEKQYFADSLSNIIDELDTKQAYIDCFVPHLSKDTKLRGVQMLASSVDQGGRYGHIHCHIVVLIRHSNRFDLQAADGMNITTRMVNWVTARCSWLADSSPYYRPDTLPYVNVVLVPAYGENYVAKDGNGADTDD